VALSRKSDGRRHLRKECFRLAIAVKDTALSTLFVVEYEGEGHTGIVGPACMGWVVAIANEVARVVAHREVSKRKSNNNWN